MPMTVGTKQWKVTGAVLVLVLPLMHCGLLAPDDGVDASTFPDAGRDVDLADAVDARDADDGEAEAQAPTLTCGTAAPYGTSSCCGDASTVCRGFCNPSYGGICDCGILGGCKGDAFCCGGCKSAQECGKK